MELPVNYNDTHFSVRKLVRQEYITRQKGLCCHCGAPLIGKPTKEMLCKKVNIALFPFHFFKWPVHLHHNHDTGMTIGAVHSYCNAVLWEYHGE